jgi:hypothetical protein
MRSSGAWKQWRMEEKARLAAMEMYFFVFFFHFFSEVLGVPEH